MSKLNNWILPFTPYELEDKEKTVNDIATHLLNRCLQIFKYEDLPETIDKRNLELLNILNGFSIWHEVDGNLYAFNAGLGGEPDPYYMPTIATVSNPALNISENLEIGDQCVLMLSDSSAKGLKSLIQKYASIIAEIDLSISVANINLRIPTIASSTNDATAKKAKLFFDDIKKGKLGVIFDAGMMGEDTFKTSPYASTSTNILTDLIELRNYYEAEFYKEIGLNQTNNMKRESLNDDEIAANEDTLKPLIDDMLEQRQIAIDEINKMFGTNIKVSLNSSWEDNEVELELKHEEIAEETETTDEEQHEEVEDTENVDETEESEETETEESEETDTEETKEEKEDEDNESE